MKSLPSSSLSSTYSIDALLSEYVKHGHISVPRMLGLDSFAMPYLHKKASDIYQSDEGDAFFYFALTLPWHGKAIYAELKLYFRAHTLLLSGLSLTPGVRLSSLLRLAPEPTRMLFDAEASAGAALYPNDVALHFRHADRRQSDFMLTEMIGAPLAHANWPSNLAHALQIFGQTDTPALPQAKSKMMQKRLAALRSAHLA